jgi:membrane-bound lytic murein transglycosylase B
MMSGRIAARSSLALIAVGLASMIGGLVWVFAGAAAGDRQPSADPGSSPATAITQQPQAGPAPQTGLSGPTAGSGSPATDPGTPETGSGSPEAVSASPVTSSDSLAAWAAGISTTTGIPARAVQGYGYAEIVLQSETPGCHLDWNTLAGIGMVESDQGQYGGASLAADGTETKPVIGPALNGSDGRRDLPAVDNGLLTGDPVYDHAVGPLQLLPETWYQYADPDTNPQNIDAAAIAAGRYLCADGRNLATPTGWWAAILAYNQSTSYADLVFHYANAYAIDLQ